MSREEELAGLLAQIGLERGVGVERLADELARVTLPGFIDGQEFRQSLVAALERQLRAQVEEQIGAIRLRIGGATSPVVDSTPPREESPRTPDTSSWEPPEAETSEPEPVVPLTSAPAPPPDMPDDATVYWAPDSERKPS